MVREGESVQGTDVLPRDLATLTIFSFSYVHFEIYRNNNYIIMSIGSLFNAI